MPTRRDFLTLTVSALAIGALSLPRAGQAQSAASRAADIIRTAGEKLVAVVNGPGAAADKRRAMTQIIDGIVDVDSVAKFCLGRYWRQASPDQQKRFLALFHEVLVTSITVKLGEYQGVKFTMGRSRRQDDTEIISTVVQRPNNPPSPVDWVMSNPDANPKIIDVVAEGTSMRLTQRSDYSAYLARNNNDIDALISAMRQQVSQAG